MSATPNAATEGQAATDLSQTEVDQWIAGSQMFNEKSAHALAGALGFDVPLFVGKALEVTVRIALSCVTVAFLTTARRRNSFVG
jgi:hypothetical protein